MTYPEDNDNVTWLSAAQETFEEAMDVENWALARAVIEDVRDIAPESAVVLERTLSEKQNQS